MDDHIIPCTSVIFLKFFHQSCHCNLLILFLGSWHSMALESLIEVKYAWPLMSVRQYASPSSQVKSVCKC